MKFRIVTILFFTFIFVGCGSSTPKPAPIFPLSHEVTFIESSSSAEVMLRAKGEGFTIADAKKDAQKAALWFVLNGGDTPMLQTSGERKAFKAVRKEFYQGVQKYITYSSGIKSKQKSHSIYSLEYVLRLNSAILKEDLIAKHILKPTEEILDGLSLPTIAVVAQDKDSKVASNVVSSYLHDKDFEVLRIAQADKVFLKVAQNISVDPIAAQMYASALSSGSDIYIRAVAQTSSRVVASKELKKASVLLSAYYTASGKEIASVTTYSQERVVNSFASVIAEASNDGANRLLAQIQNSWKKEANKGKIYKVIVTTSEDMVREVDMPLYRALKKTCTKVIPNKMINNIFDYTLQCKNISNFKELEMQIADNYAGAGQLFTEAAKGAFLVLKIANSESDEIEIE